VSPSPSLSGEQILDAGERTVKLAQQVMTVPPLAVTLNITSCVPTDTSVRAGGD
jgi:hypothetical protein